MFDLAAVTRVKYECNSINLTGIIYRIQPFPNGEINEQVWFEFCLHMAKSLFYESSVPVI